MIIRQQKSLIDKAPVMVVASAYSQNQKTGPMVQTQIIRSDMGPIEASKKGQDQSVCGNCPHRHANNGACYVKLFHEPNNVWKAFKRGSYEKPSHSRDLTRELTYRPIRIGTYGDPVSVDQSVWTTLLANNVSGRHTGYTHLWKLKRAQPYRKFLMASVDSVEEANKAHAMGWRYFLVTQSEELPQGLNAKTVLCPYNTQKECSALIADSATGSRPRMTVERTSSTPYTAH